MAHTPLHSLQLESAGAAWGGAPARRLRSAPSAGRPGPASRLAGQAADPLQLVGASLARLAAGPREPAGLAAHLERLGAAARLAQAGLLSRQASAAGRAATAAEVLLSAGAAAPALLQKLVHARLLAPAERDRLLAVLPPRQALAWRELRQALAAAVPDSVALFLAKQRLKQGEAVLEMLRQWGESLREQAKLAKLAAARHQLASETELRYLRRSQEQAAQLSRTLEQSLQATLRRQAAEWVAVPALRTLGVQGSEWPTSSALRSPLPLTSPMPNRMLLGALSLPQAGVSLPLGRTPSASVLHILARGQGRVAHW